MSKVLYLNLSNNEINIKDRSDLFEKYIGGTGVATQLLLEECPSKINPYSPENPIIFSIGPLCGIFPVCTKTVAMFKSPHTNELGESYAGGRLAMAMRFSGYNSIVIKGKAENPVYLSIHDDKVEIKDATSIWGVSEVTAIGRILRDVETGAGRRSILRIGNAGENLVSYATVNVDTYRHFGRLGLGAVFGSKNLKAIVISGTEEINLKNIKDYRKIYQKIYDEVVKTEAMEKYHDLGTSANIIVLNQIKGLPTRNLKSTSFEHADAISGEEFAEKYLVRKVACSHCQIGCIHIAMLKTQFAPGHEYELRNISYDYELIYSLGSNLGVSSPEGILKLIERCEYYGLDAISTGVVLGWATEMYERDLITPQETLGIPLQWNNIDSYLKAIDHIILKKNKFYEALSKGVYYASEEFGGKEFAIALGGNEIAGYHTGPASIVGQIVGVRHSHLDNAGYSVDIKASAQQLSEEEMVDKLIYEDDWRCICNSLITCLFARKVYSEKNVVSALASIGINKTVEELKKIGKDIFRAKYEFKIREGFDLKKIKVPRRFFETISQLGKVTPEQIENMLDLYKSKRGF
ncbi:MAG: aldehyde ferredoxin oxidoreductase family protein [Methanosarcinales archaeon]